MGGGEHQLDTVQLIDLAGAGIVIDGHHIGFWISSAQLLNHALAHHMVRQTAEGLGADNVVGTALNKLHHFSGEEPAFTCLVSDGNNGFRIGSDGLNLRRRMEMPGFLKGLHSCRTHPFHGTNARLCDEGRLSAGSQMLRLVDLVVEAVEHEVQKIRNYRFRAFRFQKLHQMVVGGRRELHQNLAHNADARLGDI